MIRTRQYVAALIPLGQMLILNTLRYADEVRTADDLEVPPKQIRAVGVTPREAQMAVKLVEEMTGKWDPDDYHDTYHEDLLALIDQRIKAGETDNVSHTDALESEEPPGRGEVVDLMVLLKRSLRKKSKRQPALKHRGTERSDRLRRKTA